MILTLKVLLIFFILNNVFLFLRTFYTKSTLNDQKYLRKNVEYYESNEINFLTFSKRMSKMLLKNNSALAILMLYYSLFFPVFWILELIISGFLVFMSFSSLVMYALLIFTAGVNLWFYYNEKSIVKDRLLIILKISWLLFLCLM